MKWARGEGVFIGQKSSGRSVLRAYVRCYCTAVQRISRTSRYYPEGIPKNSVCPILLAYIHCTHRVQSYYLSECTSDGGPPYICTTDNGVRLTFQCTFALKDRSVRSPNLVYIRSRSPISQNALLANSSDPNSKLTL